MRNPQQILVVDDDTSVLEWLAMELTGAGYMVTACANFDDAKTHVKRRCPDILVVDVRLGMFNGLYLVILALQMRPDVVAVVISAFDDEVLRKEAARLGAVYLTKPFRARKLLSICGRPRR